MFGVVGGAMSDRSPEPGYIPTFTPPKKVEGSICIRNVRNRPGSILGCILCSPPATMTDSAKGLVTVSVVLLHYAVKLSLTYALVGGTGFSTYEFEDAA